ncbi:MULTISPECIES: hypothetical protein [Burkholderia]|uniref:hypothetical protein n=1 Tax=Burkholderia TaxID=32008 RepID=UPI00104819C5|nr:hypothetical protein [Burkholderia pyrrocinia]EKS9888316.1 hypothetical protein [Burkholderia pyrrocinia]EKS9892652.1 hypothetical protein [Burkholderia pyrrocinia]TDA48194.1 hypothetical protein EVG18_06695 [Burkholderia pyrrocinia]
MILNPRLQLTIVVVIASSFAGGVLATLICWGALYAYGAFVLHGKGSLFDTSPEIAHAFFVGWGGLTAIFSAIAAIIAMRMRD